MGINWGSSPIINDDSIYHSIIPEVFRLNITWLGKDYPRPKATYRQFSHQFIDQMQSFSLYREGFDIRLKFSYVEDLHKCTQDRVHNRKHLSLSKRLVPPNAQYMECTLLTDQTCDYPIYSVIFFQEEKS